MKDQFLKEAYIGVRDRLSQIEIGGPLSISVGKKSTGKRGTAHCKLHGDIPTFTVWQGRERDICTVRFIK